MAGDMLWLRSCNDLRQEGIRLADDALVLIFRDFGIVKLFGQISEGFASFLTAFHLSLDHFLEERIEPFRRSRVLLVGKEGHEQLIMREDW